MSEWNNRARLLIEESYHLISMTQSNEGSELLWRWTISSSWNAARQERKKNQSTARVEFYMTYVKYNTVLKRLDITRVYKICYCIYMIICLTYIYKCTHISLSLGSYSQKTKFIDLRQLRAPLSIDTPRYLSLTLSVSVALSQLLTPSLCSYRPVDSHQ